MTDRPVIFSKPMIRALLAGEKTMTRRLLYSPRRSKNGIIPASATRLDGHPPPRSLLAPNCYWTLSGWERVKPGDRLYARERLCSHNHFGFPLSFGSQFQTDIGYGQRVWSYFADDVPEEITGGRPSIHCPRTFSRITLVVDAVKIEPLQNISSADVISEGTPGMTAGRYQCKRCNGQGSNITFPRRCPSCDGAGDDPWAYFRDLWRSLHGSESWDSDPEVVAMSGRVILENIDKVPA